MQTPLKLPEPVRSDRDIKDWDEGRWIDLLDRIDHRQLGIGLRFCGPPLWLEVTMEGPDSDSWSIAAAGRLANRAWNWQSTDVCDEAMALMAAGADDDQVLAAVSRYTFENLVLNATHEIGEWLRFDAQRLFPAHGARTPSARSPLPTTDDGAQGNGDVVVEINFDNQACPDPDSAFDTSVDSMMRKRADRINGLAAAWRFTYLPGKSIVYGDRGPVLDDLADEAKAATVWSTEWSMASSLSLEAPANELVGSVQRDVHRMLVLYETHRICEAFYVNGRRPWRLVPDRQLADLSSPSDPEDGERITVSIAYSSAPQ